MKLWQRIDLTLVFCAMLPFPFLHLKLCPYFLANVDVRLFQWKFSDRYDDVSSSHKQPIPHDFARTHVSHEGYFIDVRFVVVVHIVILIYIIMVEPKEVGFDFFWSFFNFRSSGHFCGRIRETAPRPR